MKKEVLLIVLCILSSTLVTAHHTETTQENDYYQSTALKLILYGTAVLLALTAIALLDKKASNITKHLLFWCIVIIIIITTLYSVTSTIYINHRSATRGPVHWHTDFEVWICGEKINLEDPTGISNRIGTPTLHEHNDNRIHIEGVLEHLEDGSLQNFFKVIGGEINHDSITLPTNEKIIKIINGETCEGQPATLQVYRYFITNPEEKPYIYQQEKLATYEDYLPAPYSYVPPADCIIITYGPRQETTTHICESYRVAENNGDIYGS